jgi:hypothetical protein
MRINHRRAHILVAQQLLHGANVITILQQMRCPRKASRLRGSPKRIFFEIIR